MSFILELLNAYGVTTTPHTLETLEQAWNETQETRTKIAKRAQCHQARVLAGCHQVKLFDTDLSGTHGYGLDDTGREKLDRLFAFVLKTESAFVRSQFVSGTHALTTALFACLRPGKQLLSLTGEPYDTLIPVLGHQQATVGSLSDWGVKTTICQGISGGVVNTKQVEEQVKNVQPDVVYLQRSCGYDWIDSHRLSVLEQLITLVKQKKPECIVLVDNCYGEFVEQEEPGAIGADLFAGSLIKNLGGQLAQTGGYVAGKKHLIQRVAAHATSPGIMGHQGATFDFTRKAAQGLTLSPLFVGESLAASVLAAHVFEQLRFSVRPKWHEPRTDIIQAIKASSPEIQQMICNAIQSAGFVDSQVRPEPHAQPGYRDPILMAGGSFVQGATLELSADGPLREPFAVYLQGGFMSQMLVGLASCLSLLEKEGIA